jgi:hypothetical protein
LRRGSYISDDFQQREDDIAWKIKVGGDWDCLYLLIEFQLRVDKHMALRMMVYIGLLYQDLIKCGDVLADGLLIPTLPIVLYNASQRWTSITDVADLIPVVPGLVEQFKPRLKYLLIDENTYSDTKPGSGYPVPWMAGSNPSMVPGLASRSNTSGNNLSGTDLH